MGVLEGLEGGLLVPTVGRSMCIPPARGERERGERKLAGLLASWILITLS